MSLIIDEELLKKATQELGFKTYSETVNAALKEAVRRKNVSKLADFVGKLKWIGDLSEMRGDNPRHPPRVRRKKNRAKPN